MLAPTYRSTWYHKPDDHNDIFRCKYVTNTKMTSTKSWVQVNQYMNACCQKASYSATSATSSNKADVLTVQVFLSLLHFLSVAITKCLSTEQSLTGQGQSTVFHNYCNITYLFPICSLQVLADSVRSSHYTVLNDCMIIDNEF